MSRQLLRFSAVLEAERYGATCTVPSCLCCLYLCGQKLELNIATSNFFGSSLWTSQDCDWSVLLIFLELTNHNPGIHLPHQ